MGHRGIFLIHWVIAALFFKDIPLPPSLPQPQGSDELRLETPSLREIIRRMDKRQWGVVVTMCWFAMTCFFMLGAWQSNVPIFSSTSSTLSPGAVSATISLLFNNPADRLGEQAHPKQPFHWSPFASGNFLALGGDLYLPVPIPEYVLYASDPGQAHTRVGLRHRSDWTASHRRTDCGPAVPWLLDLLDILCLLVPRRTWFQPRNDEHT